MFKLLSLFRGRAAGALIAAALLVAGCDGGSSGTVVIGGVKLAFTATPPASVGAGSPFGFTVAVQNALGATVDADDVLITVTFVDPVGTIANAGGGTANGATIDGLAQFEFTTNTAQTLTFNITASGLTGITGTEVVVETLAPLALAYGTAPQGTEIVDAAWTTFTVEVRDALDNLVTDATGTVTIALDTGMGSFTNATKNIAGGVATFNDLSYDTTESIEIHPTTSIAGVSMLPVARMVDIQCGVAGVAAQLAFGNAVDSTQVAGVAWDDGTNPDFTVEVQDCFGDVVATDNATMVTASVTTGGGFTGGSTLTEQAASGIATFDNLVYNTAEDVTLDFTATSLDPIQDVMVTVAPAAIASLTFTGDPAMSQNLAATSTITVPVDAADTFGNPVSGQSIVLSIGTNPGSGVLRATQPTVSTDGSGTATFNNVGISLVGTGYTLRATHMPTGTMQPSLSFNIIPGPASTISFATMNGGVQPPATTTTDSGDNFGVTVRVRDFYTNNVADGTVVTLTRNGGTFADTPVLETGQAMNQATTTSGLASWTGVNLTKAGTGTALRASSGAATPGDSSPFNVTHGVAHHLAFGTAPTTPATDTVRWEDFTVAVLDANDNRVTSDSTHTVGVSENGSGSFTSGTATRTLDSGLATFNDLVYTLSNPAAQEMPALTFATNFSSELIKTAVDGAVVTVNPGPIPAKTAYYVDHFMGTPLGDINPGDGDTIIESVNETWSPIVIEIQDTMGERAFTDSSTTVTLSVTGGTGTLMGTLMQSAVKGRVIFDDLSYDVVETVTIQIDNDAMLSNPRDSITQPQVQVLPMTNVGLAIERASLTSAEAEVDCISNGDICHVNASVSADGRFIAFESLTALASESNLGRDIFVRDRIDGTTSLVSTNGAGGQGGFANNFTPAISANGRFVAFATTDSNLTNGTSTQQIVLKDRSTAELVLVSRTAADVPVAGNGVSKYAAISADGRYVAFSSLATDLVSGIDYGMGANTKYFVYARDLALGVTELVSVDIGGGLPDQSSGVNLQSNGSENTSYFGANPISISADGRYVAFESAATDLIVSDTNSAVDIFVRDRVTETTTRVNISTGGTPTSPPSAGAHNPSLSADGRFVAFDCNAATLVADDTNSTTDVFVRDRMNSTTSIVSISDAGDEGNAASSRPSISADGRYVAFDSADNSVFRESGDGSSHVYVHDRDTDEDGTYDESGARHTYQANRDAAGVPSATTGRVARVASLSANGAYIAFESTAQDLVTSPADGSSSADIYVAPVLHDFGIFVLSNQFTPGAAFDGTVSGAETFASLADADTACNQVGAATFGNDTVWVAWLSDESENGIDRVQAGLDTSAEAGRWYQAGAGGTLGAMLVAPGVAKYSSGSLTNAVGNYEDGSSAGMQAYWTGTLTSGLLETGFTCTSWTTTGGSGRPGEADQSGGNWSGTGSIMCNNARSLLCLQVD